jgi:serine/threonine-protein kinase
MGEVYRARDAKLNRDVALKVLLPEVASDPERLARFRREAQVLASLNYPHIGGIHGLEESDGTIALVLELVEGPTLADRIARGAIPLEEALPIAKQIAEALAAAHEQGIIHRDLKPANIKVRDDGTVKVLDFGLAKALDQGSGIGGQGSGSVANSPTITSPAMTQAGIILGTAAYMAPEQAKGKSVDKRADIWAFGCVLFEMLAGKRPFDGEDITDTIVAVMSRAPDFATLPPDTPLAIRTLLRRCLEKDRTRRLPDAAVIRLEIDDVLVAPAGIEQAASAPAVEHRTAAARVLPWALVATFGLALVAAAASWLTWGRQAPSDRPLTRLDVTLGEDVSLPVLPLSSGSVIIVSPDGTRLAYESGTPPALFTRRLDQASPVRLAGTEGASGPFFSPDGQWIGFASDGDLHKVSVEGGTVVRLGVIGSFGGGSWGDDDTIVVSGTGVGLDIARRSLLRISADGGEPETIVTTKGDELGLITPKLLPGGKAVLYAVDNIGPAQNTTIEVVTLADHRRTVLVRGGASPTFLPTSGGVGHLVYASGTTLFAIPFDPNTLQTRGTAVPVINSVAVAQSSGSAQFDVSRSGTVVYRTPGAEVSSPARIAWLAPSGRTEMLPAPPDRYLRPRISPDGRRIALIAGSGSRSGHVWIYDILRDAMTRLTSDDFKVAVVWSSDGQQVAFSTGVIGISIARADGANPPQSVLRPQGALSLAPWSFSPDGRRLAYSQGTQLWTVPLEQQGGQWKAGTPERFVDDTQAPMDANALIRNVGAAFSPDGRWLAYASAESGKSEVYVRPSPPASETGGPSTSLRTGKWQVSNSGGSSPQWSKTGDVIYQSGDQILAARYTVSGDTFVPDKPRVWIAKYAGTEWDLAPDGTRIVALMPVEGRETPKADNGFVFLEHFFDELRRRAPLPR